jgi:hypothetical protein
MLSVSGEALKVTRRNEQAEGDRLALCTSIVRCWCQARSFRSVLRGAQSGFAVLACIVPKCTAGYLRPVGPGLSKTSEPRIWPGQAEYLLTFFTAECPRIGRMPQSREIAPKAGECTPRGLLAAPNVGDN